MFIRQLLQEFVIVLWFPSLFLLRFKVPRRVHTLVTHLFIGGVESLNVRINVGLLDELLHVHLHLEWLVLSPFVS